MLLISKAYAILKANLGLVAGLLIVNLLDANQKKSLKLT